MALMQIIGIYSVSFRKEPIAFIAALLFVTAWLVCLRRGMCRQWHIAILIFLMYGALLALKQNQPDGLSEVLASDVECIDACITGKVVKIRDKSATREITIKDCDIGVTGQKEPLHTKKLLVYAPYSLNECHEGDRIQVEGELSEFSSAMNMGEFDFKKYYFSMNIRARVFADSFFVVAENKNRMLEAVFNIKDKMRASFSAIAEPEDAGIITSMLLGDKSELDSSVNSLYQQSGIAHILAISGLHISMLGMALYKIMRRAGFGFTQSAVTSSLLISLYGCMTGNAVSAIRAIVMFAVSSGAQALGRKYDILSSSSLASIIILSDSPAMLANSSFLLSFGAVIGIAAVYPVFGSFFPEWNKTPASYIARALLTSLATSVSVSLTTLPVLLTSFYEFPPLSIFLNLIIIPLMGLLMACGAAAGVLGIFNTAAGSFVMGTVHYILALYKLLCNVSGEFQFGRIIAGSPQGCRIVIYYCLLLAVVAAPSYIKLQRKLAAVLLPCIAGMLLLMFYNPVNELQVHVLYIGQGDGIYAKLPDGSGILFDGGSSDKKDAGKYILAPCLKSSGISRLDYVFISHLDEDHYNAAVYLLENQSETGIIVKNLILPDIAQQDEDYKDLAAMAKRNGTRVAAISSGDRLDKMAGKFSIECLAPDKVNTYSDKNAASMVLRMRYGSFSMLLTGDLQNDGEEELIGNPSLTCCDVLKVAHHGSKYSTTEAMLDIVKPRAAIISCGKNNRYGHPHEETLQRLEASRSSIYVTKDAGEVIIRAREGQFNITSYVKPF